MTNIDDTTREWLTTAEAAALIGIAQRTVNDAVNRGSLRAIHPHDRLTLVHRQSAIDYKENHKGKQGWPKGKPRKKKDAP